MEKNNKKATQQQLDLIEKEMQQEMERQAILMKADEIKEETFSFDIEGQIELKNEIADLILEQIDDPESKYDLYYNALDKLLRRNLPKGKEHERARQIIYEEKKTFLTKGHRINKQGIRGADSRMSYISDIHEMVNIVSGWIVRNGTMFDLYTELRDLNVSKGYGKPAE